LLPVAYELFLDGNLSYSVYHTSVDCIFLNVSISNNFTLLISLINETLRFDEKIRKCFCIYIHIKIMIKIVMMIGMNMVTVITVVKKNDNNNNKNDKMMVVI